MEWMVNTPGYLIHHIVIIEYGNQMRVRITWNAPDGKDGKTTWLPNTSYCYYRVLKLDEGQEDLEYSRWNGQ